MVCLGINKRHLTADRIVAGGKGHLFSVNFVPHERETLSKANACGRKSGRTEEKAEQFTVYHHQDMLTAPLV
ncbi:hypothetical protein KIPB_014713, partial [Kipferlia bialata]|eukprot:g14713.t1